MDQKSKRRKPSFFGSLMMLLLKFAVIGLLAVLIFSYIFGLARNQSLNMQPAVQDGDLLFYYRIVQSYQSDQMVVVTYEGRKLPQRVIATAGDSVDITDKGLEINGSVIVEPEVLGETTQFENQVTFPLTVPPGQVFLLGDNRPNAIDSRVFGCVDENDIDGKVIGLFRRRNL